MLNTLRNVSQTELIVIVAVLLLLFGAKAVTKLARTSGETIREIKKVKKSFNESLGDSNGSTKQNKKGV